ncbi:MAG TPA: hemerythrin domain-containing protein [Thermoanaerobaculia bacterium]|nr:hemerythrin domain-containing protein [Thermoanaerobaculia bacterium]
MQLIDDLRAEHVVIERMLGALATYVDARIAGRGDPADADAFLAFFRLFAGRYHHAREEDTLFPALLAHLPIRPDSGPVRSLFDQHASMARTLEEMAPLLGEPGREGERLRELATRHRRDLLAHIDAENSVLLPESEVRLRRAGLADLVGRPPDAEESAARDGAGRLLALYPPSEDPAAIRGEGCVICPSYGVSCEGLEREWWSEQEWDDFRERDG